MPNKETIVRKTEFAKLRGVSPARVSQWIATGRIGPEALVGEGRLARVRVEAAVVHLARATSSSSVETDGTIVSKSKFANLRGVSPARVSQWIAAGRIRPEALVGEGRSARIHVETAVANLQRRDHLAEGDLFGWLLTP